MEEMCNDQRRGGLILIVLEERKSPYAIPLA
jgi:hypothetical protein